MKILKKILELSWVDSFNLFVIGFVSAGVVNAFVRRQIIDLCILVPLLLLTICIRKVATNNT